MGLDGIYRVPEFQYQHKVEKHEQRKEGRQNPSQQEQGKKKKSQNSEHLFANLADSLGQYSEEPFQFSG